ncbi:uncharacterized protein FIBRA_07650 [Fibroporia radiculosa]|uniref:REJ domain-containing protein n=1 Tax=Fibroporia radiculosa TaxID=599839 RepID=J4GF74_9APHY|nr:uncharacterized protein FIBRA_07650 [Fibroporia radiculosa]CCM05433.1 predicted protein [Fibroporia radiculosa]
MKPYGLCNVLRENNDAQAGYVSFLSFLLFTSLIPPLPSHPMDFAVSSSVPIPVRKRRGITLRSGPTSNPQQLRNMLVVRQTPSPGSSDAAGSTSQSNSTPTQAASAPTSDGTAGSGSTSSTESSGTSETSSPSTDSSTSTTSTSTSTSSQASLTTSTSTTSTSTSSSTHETSISSLSSSSSSSNTASSSSTTSPTSSPIHSPTSTSISPTSSSTTTSSWSPANTSTSSSSTWTPSPTANSGSLFTTITSSEVTTINGIRTTTPVAIVTTLSAPASTTSDATNKGIIAGSVVGVGALLVLAFAMIMFYRRHQHKKLNFFKGPQAKPRSLLLAGEDNDDYDLGPPTQSYRDYPNSMVTHSRATSYNAGSLNDLPMTPADATMQAHNARMPSPYLLGLRASESGSLFQEGVWPPPRAGFIDPLASTTDDLTRIVDDVMGPTAAERQVSGGPIHMGLAAAPAVRLVGGGATEASASAAPLDAPLPLDQTVPQMPESPQAPTWQSPLFVTNMGSETASILTAASPPNASRSLPPQRRPSQDDDLGEFSMGEAL